MKTLSYETYNKNRIKIVDAILHYERIRMNVESATRQNCPLCQKYNSVQSYPSNACEGCPIFEITEEQFCRNTPFAELSSHHRASHTESPTITNDCEICNELINKELQFLRSLHPFEVGDEVQVLREWTDDENSAYNTGKIDDISKTGTIERISERGNCLINENWYPPVVLAKIQTNEPAKPKTQVSYKRIIHRGEKRILITGFFNVLNYNDLPSAYTDVSPYYNQAYDGRSIYSSWYGYISMDKPYTIREFDDLIAHLKECSARLRTINKQQEIENASWDGEGTIEM
jgi:hypothetical protein